MIFGYTRIRSRSAAWVSETVDRPLLYLRPAFSVEHLVLLTQVDALSALNCPVREGARVVEWGRLLSGCGPYKSTEGSNPSLPA